MMNPGTANLDISIEHFTDPFYYETWFWGCVALFLFFILVLLIRGKKSKMTSSQSATSSIKSDSSIISNQQHLKEQSTRLDQSS